LLKKMEREAWKAFGQIPGSLPNCGYCEMG